MKLKNLIPCSLILLLGLACATPQGSEDVKVSVVNLRFGESTVFETTANFEVRVQNATPVPLRLRGGTHKLYLNGAYVGEGLSNEAVEIPALGTGTQSVAVHLRNLSMATRIHKIIETRAADYRLQSVLYVERKGGFDKIRTSDDGRVDLNELGIPRQP